MTIRSRHHHWRRRAGDRTALPRAAGTTAGLAVFASPDGVKLSYRAGSACSGNVDGVGRSFGSGASGGQTHSSKRWVGRHGRVGYGPTFRTEAHILNLTKQNVR